MPNSLVGKSTTVLKDVHTPCIVDLPMDILAGLVVHFLGPKKYMFIYVMSSCKTSNKMKVNGIYNSITYVRLFIDI